VRGEDEERHDHEQDLDAECARRLGDEHQRRDGEDEDKSASVSAARRVKKFGPSRIRSRLMETATNRRPVSAAVAPTIAAKKVSHPAVV
jgi:hypothetical protein